ncbi:MAG: hypothetical protein RJQ14_15700 [Marinoscillum sp.]
MKKWIIISLAILTFSCDQRELATTIQSDDLINLDYKELSRIDSAMAIQLLRKNSEMHGWLQTVEILKQVMPEGYLTENLNYEREKAIQDFVQSNQFFSYSIKVKDDNYRGIIIRSVNNPESRLEEGHHLQLFLTDVKGRLKKPILIHECARIMVISEFAITSSTKIYSDQSIEMVMKTDGCSDIIGTNGKTSCDSTIITNTYKINVDLGEISFSSDTVEYEYEI